MFTKGTGGAVVCLLFTVLALHVTSTLAQTLPRLGNGTTSTSAITRLDDSTQVFTLSQTLATMTSTDASHSGSVASLGAIILSGIGVVGASSATAAAEMSSTTSPAVSDSIKSSSFVDQYVSTARNGSTISNSVFSLPVSITRTRNNTSTSSYPYSLPTNGAGTSYAAACVAEWERYDVSSWRSAKPYAFMTSWTFTNYTAVYTTLCDGQPRALGTLTPTATITQSSIDSSYSYTYDGATPACSVAQADCSALCSSYDSADKLYSSASTVTVLVPATPTALTVENAALGTNITVIGTPPVTAWPTLTVYGTAYTPTVRSGTPHWQFPGGWLPLTPGGSAIYSRNISSPTACYAYRDAYSGPCQSYYISSMAYRECPYQTDCVIGAGEVKLYYFPATTSASRDMCATRPSSNQTTFDCPGGSRVGSSGRYDPTYCSYPKYNATTTMESGPYTVMDGYTFYQNRAYISLQAASATVLGCGAIGKTYFNQIIPVQTSDLYSVCRNGPYMSSVLQYNLADLQAPVPASAWACQPFCWFMDSMHAPPSSANASYVTAGTKSYNIFPQKGGYCANIIADQAYRPLLAVPLQIRGLDPAWSTCALNLFGLYDPPIALTAVATIATATLPGFIPATTTATPGPGIATNLTPPVITPSPPTPHGGPTASRVPEPQSEILQGNGQTGAVDPQSTIVTTSPHQDSSVRTTFLDQGSSDLLPSVVIIPPVTVVDHSVPTASLKLGSITGFVIASQTLTAGGSPLTISGSLFSALPSGSGLQVVVNGHTSTLIPSVTAAQPMLSVDFTAQGWTSQHAYTIGSQTIIEGQVATADGTVYSVGSGFLFTAPTPTALKTQASDSAFTIGEHVITAGQSITYAGTIYSDASGTLLACPTLQPAALTSRTAYTISSHTITDGQAVTIDSTLYSDISGILYTGSVASRVSTTSPVLTAVYSSLGSSASPSAATHTSDSRMWHHPFSMDLSTGLLVILALVSTLLAVAL